MRIQLGLVGLLAVCVGGSAHADVLWDNGSFDGRSGLSSNSLWETWTADDFIVAAPIRIEQATAEFYVDPPADGPFELADIGVWTEPVPGEGPQDLVVAATVEGLGIELEPGDYFFSMRLRALFGGLLLGHDGRRGSQRS